MFSAVRAGKGWRALTYDGVHAIFKQGDSAGQRSQQQDDAVFEILHRYGWVELPEQRVSQRSVVADADVPKLCDEELELAKRALGLPEVATSAAQDLEPHRIPFYLLDLAGGFHRYYNKATNRIIGPERELSLARLYLAGLLRLGLAEGLGLLGVSAPERM